MIYKVNFCTWDTANYTTFLSYFNANFLTYIDAYILPKKSDKYADFTSHLALLDTIIWIALIISTISPPEIYLYNWDIDGNTDNDDVYEDDENVPDGNDEPDEKENEPDDELEENDDPDDNDFI